MCYLLKKTECMSCDILFWNRFNNALIFFLRKLLERTEYSISLFDTNMPVHTLIFGLRSQIPINLIIFQIFPNNAWKSAEICQNKKKYWILEKAKKTLSLLSTQDEVWAKNIGVEKLELKKRV